VKCMGGEGLLLYGSDLPWSGSALGLGTFSSYLKVHDGAVFAMNPDKVPLSKSSVPAELRGRKALLVAQVSSSAVSLSSQTC
jgi:hypothetical protein